MTEAKQKKILVVGAGLAGLVSALSLQSKGHSVVLVERRAQAGGLCGTFYMDGYEFVIACNDFGTGLKNLLHDLNVNKTFEHKKSSVFYRREWFNAAPDLSMLWKLRGEWRNILSVIRGVLKHQLRGTPRKTMEEFANCYATPGAVNDFVKIISYFMGVAPSDIYTSYFGLDSQYGYGYTKMVCPVGGPQSLTDAIVDRFSAQGGALLLNAQYHRCERANNRYLVEVDHLSERRIFEVDYIVDTGNAGDFSQDKIKSGLPLTMMCMVLDDGFKYPADTHTLSYYEPNVSDWFGKLDKGIKPERFGFHIFKSDLKKQPENCYSVNVYFYLPRGVDQLDAAERSDYKKYIFNRLEEMLPGISKFVIYSRLITPEDFEAIHGLSSRVMPFVGVLDKPGNRKLDENYFYAGHKVYPPGEHAGAAALSGHIAAKIISLS